MLKIALFGGILLAACCGRDPADKGGELQATVAQITKTKAAMSDALVASWAEGDDLAIAASDGSAVRYILSSAPAKTSTFAPDGQEYNPNEGQTAVYPYSAFVAQSSDGDLTVSYPATYSYAKGELRTPMTATVTADGSASFSHIGGILRLKCTGVSSKARSVRITADGKRISGKFTLGSNGAANTINSSDNNEVVVNFAGSADNSVNLNIPLPTGTYPSISAFICDASGDVITGGVVASNAEFERGTCLTCSIDNPLLTVMTYNIRFNHADHEAKLPTTQVWDVRKVNLVKGLDRKVPDVIGSQENTGAQVSYILGALKVKYSALGKDLAGNQPFADGTEAEAIYTRNDRIEVLESGTFWFSDTPDTPKSKFTGAVDTRACTWAKLKLIATGEEFYVFNNHLHVDKTDNDNKTVSYADLRQRQVELVLTRIKQVSDSYPVIWTGDFNGNSEDKAYTTIINDGTMSDARLLSPQPGGHPSTLNYFKAADSGRTIDFVFVNDKCQVHSYAVDNSQQSNGQWESDHNPVTVSISFK